MSKIKQFAEDASKLLTRHEIRVAVCGMQNSGKTVFLTALADHLLHHDPQGNRSDDRRFDLGDFVVGDDADIVDAHEPEESIGNFDFQKYRNEFGNNRWPEKTIGTSELVLDFTLENPERSFRSVFGRGSSKRRSVRLRFLDVPGERLADFLMDGRDYGQWCDALLGNSKHHRRHLDDYGKEIVRELDGKEDGPTAATIALKSYKKALDRAKDTFDRFVTPSTRRIPLDGSDPKKFPDKLLCGLKGAEFAPLPQILRERLPKTAKIFSEYYRKYHKKVVRPVVDWMRTADRALFLVDVFSCLNGGMQAYNGAVAETEAALDAIGNSSVLDAARYLATRFVPRSRVPGGGIRIVVTKMDLADEQGRKNLLSLACQMFGKKARAVTGFKSSQKAFIPCAAVQTDEAKAGGSETRKRQYPGIPDGKADEPGAGIPKAIPEDLDPWKDKFRLKEINPAWFNLRDDLPPKHAGLDDVACFVLGIPPSPHSKASSSRDGEAAR